MSELSIHERVAYALASSRVVGDNMTYDEILAQIKESTPDEAEVLAKSEASYQGVVNIMRVMEAKDIPASHDEWLDRCKALYDKRQAND